MWFIWLMVGAIIGGTIGFGVLCLFAGNQYEKGYVDGFKNGKSLERRFGKWAR